MGHYIDKQFKLHQPLLAFIQIEGHHTGSNFAHMVHEVLETYNIADKLFCITTAVLNPGPGLTDRRLQITLYLARRHGTQGFSTTTCPIIFKRGNWILLHVPDPPAKY